MPNSNKKDVDYDYDYSKNYKDPESERPGEFQGIDWDKVNETMKKDGAVCEWGQKQTPINLDTKIDILEGFQDSAFKFSYDWMVPKN